MAIPVLEIEWTREQLEDSSFKLTGTVATHTNIGGEVFVFQFDLQGVSTFYSICTVDQLVTLPKDEPLPGSVFYLAGSFDKTFTSARDMLDAQEDYRVAIQKVVEEWALLQDELLQTYTEVFTAEEEA